MASPGHGPRARAFVRAAAIPERDRAGGLRAPVLAGLLLTAGAAAATTPTPLWQQVPAPAAEARVGAWLAEALPPAPSHCADPQPALTGLLDPDMPVNAFRMELPAMAAGAAWVVYAHDLILERLLIVGSGVDGCATVVAVGRAWPFSARAVPSVYPNARFAGPSGPRPLLLLTQDHKSARGWLRATPAAAFDRLNAALWLLLGGYATLLLVLMLIGLNYALWQRSRLAVAYVFHVCCLQLYQLQAIGTGPAWLPFWPQGADFAPMQALTVALVVAGIGAAVTAFLAPRGALLRWLVLGTGLSSAVFLLSAWWPQMYRIGALSLIPLALVTVATLIRGLRAHEAYRRWFALGLVAMLIGGGVQGAALFLFRDPTLLAGLAFPLGTLAESVLWLLAVGRQVADERRRVQARLRHEAEHDPLTGLPNRRRLNRELAACLTGRAGQPPGLLLADLDRFKAINDSLGQGQGDQVLISVGRALRHQAPATALVAHLGSDEFAILLPARDLPGTTERLLRYFGKPLRADSGALHVSISIGCCIADAEHRVPDDLLRDAGAALGAAKAAGGGRCAHFSPPLRERILRRFRLEQELQQALRQQVLTLLYQPVIALPERSLDGFEALVRWEHPQLGPIPPAEFIPLAEERGLITLLGDQVLTAACRQIHRWQQQGRWTSRLYVGVNLSGGQLLDARLPERIDDLLGRFGLAPTALHLELTETAVIANLEMAQALLPRLRERGIALCMDDFGTGYSALGYLNRLPFDVLKIDRSFVVELETSARSLTLVRTILAMAEALGLEVITEGVETPEQARLLTSLGARHIQGWLYARALPPEQAADWLPAPTAGT